MTYYLAEEQALSSIADAIREKTNNEEELSFPSGFIQSIGDIETSNPIELIPLTISANDIYTAPEGKAYDSIIAEVPTGYEVFKSIIEQTATSPVLPDNLTYIGPYTFYRQNNLISPVLPSGIQAIDSYAFAGCYNLTFTSTHGLPPSLLYIGKYAFDQCMQLNFLGFPNALSEISEGAFRECQALSISFLPMNLKNIGNYAFQNCMSLTEIQFRSKPNFISPTAFVGCTNLTEIYVPWSENAVANAPWGATNATIHYNYMGEQL